MKYSSYPDYLKTNISWLKESPSHWKIKRLRFVIHSNPVKSEVSSHDEDELVSFVPMEAITEKGEMALEIEKPISDVYSGYTFFKNNDVVLAKITPCFENGKGAIAKNLTNGIGFGTTEFHVLRTLEETYYCWLYYLTVCYPFRAIGASEMFGAGGQKRIPETFIKDFRIGIPSLNEQNQIAKFLDHKTAQIDSLIEKKKNLIEKLNEKRMALITQAVTKGLSPDASMKPSGVDWLGDMPAHWEIRRLKECSELISKGTTPSTEGLQILDKGEIRFIKAENISNGTISETPLNYIDQHANLVLKRSILKENDILFVIAGATLGKIAVVKLEHLPANTNQAVAFIRPSCKVNPLYLHYWLQSHFIKEMTWLFAVQSAQPNLAMGVLGNFIMLLPDVEEQNQVIDFIHSELIKIDELLRINNQTIERLTEYRTALITAAVTGKIDVRGIDIPSQEAA